MHATLRCLSCGILFAAVQAIGCGGGDSAPPAAAIDAAPTPVVNLTPPAQPAMPAPKQPIAVPADARPDQVVTVFLDALRHGDEATTAHLLTTKARSETAKHGYAVAPESAPNASYKVAQAQILPENPHGAHVTSVWTETYQEQQPDGRLADKSITYEIVWVLRNETPSGWRIAGMAVEIIPGQEPEFMNFEDPEDMMRKREAAIAAQQPPAQAPPGNFPAGSLPPGELPANGAPPIQGQTFSQPINANGPAEQVNNSPLQAAQQPGPASSDFAPNRLR